MIRLLKNAFESKLNLISEMKDSKTVLAAYHANDLNVGMSSSRNLHRFKLFLADTGLFTTLLFKDRDFTENMIMRLIFYWQKEKICPV